MPNRTMPARLQVEGRPTVIRLEPMIKEPKRSPLRHVALIFAILLLALAAAFAAAAGAIIEHFEDQAMEDRV